MKTIYSKNLDTNTIIVEREFAAPLDKTWQAWTDTKILDQWWAPKPWRAETKSMDFRDGGSWLYCMVGPEGERHWARMDFRKIVAPKYYLASDVFCDENGKTIPEPPGMDWKAEFSETQAGTKVVVTLVFANRKALDTIVEMGFEDGFRAAHDNLDALLEKSIHPVN
jgi:uncharacterized protein YndB with AHSA1/START domain